MEYKNLDKKSFMHDDSLWTKTAHIKTSFNDEYVKVTKSQDIKRQELYYPTFIKLSGNFRIELDIKSEHGEFISYILNNAPKYGGTKFGWRKINKWTHLKIVRINNLVEVFYGKSNKPQVSYDNDMNQLFFIIRFNGFSNENTLFYKNLIISQNENVLFMDNYQKDSLKYLEDKINTLTNKVNYMEKAIDSQNMLFNNIFVHYELSPKDTIKYSHELYKEMLTFIDNVCKKYDLKWWLIGGSLLGAYRHGGFIPWDDDCDIALIRKDYDKFLEVIQNELKENNLERNISVKTNFHVKNFLITFAKMNFIVNDTLLGFIDIFPYDFTNDSTNNKQRFVKVQKKARKSLNNNVDKNIVLNDVFKKLKLRKEYGKYVITGIEDSANYFALFDSDIVFPLKKISFEDKQFPCPNDTVNYLSLVYGDDFMKIPNVVYGHGFHDRLLKTENIDEKFERNLEKIKKVNKEYK